MTTENKAPRTKVWSTLPIALLLLLISGLLDPVTWITLSESFNAGFNGTELNLSIETSPFQLFSTGILILVVLVYWRYFLKKPLKQMGFTLKNLPLAYTKGFIIGAVFFTAHFALNFALQAIHVKNTLSTVNWGIFALYIIGWIIQGMSEEVLCRGFIMNRFAESYGVPIGIAVNSLFFAALHLGNPGITLLSLINLVLFGILMSLIYTKTQNIWMIAAIHTAWNFFQSNIFGVLCSGQPVSTSLLATTSVPSKAFINGGDFGFEGGITETLLHVALIILVVCLVKPAHKKSAGAKV
jgi:membrane protease YdiL (CAAX protease family)